MRGHSGAQSQHRPRGEVNLDGDVMEIQEVAREGVLVLTDVAMKEVKFTMEDGYKIIQINDRGGA